MSIIGTRPPLISETNFYELHHRASSDFYGNSCSVPDIQKQK